MDWVPAHENTFRLSVFVIGFLVFLILGLLAPYRKTLSNDRVSRWWKNIFFTVSNSLILKLAGPATLSGLALIAQKHQVGVLNLLHFNGWVELALALVALDMMIYWQHRCFHSVPLLWRLHRLHHSDTEFDVTTAGRFHPFEIIISYAIKAIAIFVLGLSAAAIILFEVLLNFCAMFNHSNFSLGRSLEPVVRRLIVTPSMHRIHHSVLVNETNSNYGFCLSCWDRLFRSYRKTPQEDPRTMPIGIKEFRSPTDQTLWKLIIQPFSSTTPRQ